jgi:hypothetical protein
MHFTAVRRKDVVPHFAVLMGFAGTIAGYVALCVFTLSKVFENRLFI